MTPILKKQLTLLSGTAILVGALLWNSDVIRAQDRHGESRGEASARRKLTRDEAAKTFATLLHTEAQGERTHSYLTYKALHRSVSQKSERELGSGTSGVIEALSLQWQRPNQTTRIKSEGDKTAVVVVEAEPLPPERSFVLIEEDGAWGVDLVETYAQWNNLEGVSKAEEIYDLFGVVLDDLPRDENFKREMCQSNLKQIGLAIKQYAQDYDECYPLAKSWTALQTYMRSEAAFTCPSLPKQQSYGYAYNSKVSGKSERALSNPNNIVLIYETTLLRRNAYGMGENLAFRHEGGANFGFADGHVKWFAKSKTPSFNLNP